MKTVFYSLIALMLCTSATCRKAQSGGTALERTLIGEWKYSGKSGGFAGRTEKADPAVNRILEFKIGLRYLQKVNDQVSEQGSYELHKVESIYSGKEDNAIHFSSTSNHPFKNSIISVKNDTLIIADNVYDGFTTEYIRVK